MWNSRSNNELTIKLKQMRKMILGVAIFATIGLTTGFSQTNNEVVKTEQCIYKYDNFWCAWKLWNV